ncbi:hypothetical protein [Cyanobacterium aponinum]|nr:hypothetical protein [Cyanobacterium aponinum]
MLIYLNHDYKVKIISRCDHRRCRFAVRSLSEKNTIALMLID